MLPPDSTTPDPSRAAATGGDGATTPPDWRDAVAAVAARAPDPRRDVPALLTGAHGTDEERARVAAAVRWLASYAPSGADAAAPFVVDAGSAGVVAVAAARRGVDAVVLAPDDGSVRAAERLLEGAGDDVRGRVRIAATALTDIAAVVPPAGERGSLLVAALDLPLGPAQRRALVPVLEGGGGRLAAVGLRPRDLLELAETWDIVTAAAEGAYLRAVARPPADAAASPGRAGKARVAPVVAAALDCAWREAAVLRRAAEQAVLDAEDRDWVVARAEDRVAEAEQRAKDERRRADQAERLAAERSRDGGPGESARELARARDRAEREAERRREAERKLAALRQRRWWRLGQLLGSARRDPRRLVRLPVDVARLARRRGAG